MVRGYETGPVYDTTGNRLVYVGPGQGNYRQETDFRHVGGRQGDWDLEAKKMSTGHRPDWVVPAAGCICCLAILLPLILLFGQSNVASGQDEFAACNSIVANPLIAANCCVRGFPQHCAPTTTKAPVHVHDQYFTNVRTVPVPHIVPVPIPGPPARVVVKRVYTKHHPYDCRVGYADWKHLWSPKHQRYCCYKFKEACVTKVRYQNHYKTVTHVRHVNMPVKVPVPADPPKEINHIVPIPVPDPRRVVKIPMAGHTHVVKEYIKQKHYVPEPVPSPPEYRYKPVPVIVHEPGRTISVPEPLAPKTVYKEIPIIRAQHLIRKRYYDCDAGFRNWNYGWSKAKKEWCCAHQQAGCPGTWAGNGLTKTIVTRVTQHVGNGAPSFYQTRHAYPVEDQGEVYDAPPVYHEHRYAHVVDDVDCEAGFSNWYHRWSARKQAWCCRHANRGCPGTWHGFSHGGSYAHGYARSYVHSYAHVAHRGHAAGTLYDCDAGFSNWIHGWSASKKDWCCRHEHKGCSSYDCHGPPYAWSHDHREWCCGNFQKGCPHTTLSPLGCDAPCTLHGETSSCKDRIDWTAQHSFEGHSNACSLAYSRVQVECDVCRACTIQEAGCQVAHSPGSLPYDCNAALSNFFRAWSPEKKHWCCSSQGKGCEGNHPPPFDPGAGMIWRHVQVNGYWTWQVVSAGGTSGSLPFDCNAGRARWQVGWSQAKKRWCCAHVHFGCSGGATTVVTHHSYAFGSGSTHFGGSEGLR